MDEKRKWKENERRGPSLNLLQTAAAAGKSDAVDDVFCRRLTLSALTHNAMNQ
jgi:hypothetical protein